MKKLLFFIPVMMAGAAAYAQNDCSKNHPIYKFDNVGTAKTVRTLGSDPEFPFLRNHTTAQGVLAALKSSENKRRYPRQMRELNTLLTEAGFDNGVQDVKLSSITPYTVPAGTTGNMGNGHFGYNFVQMQGGSHKAWKLTSDNQCSITFFSACGNAFYPGSGAENATTFTGNKPACKDVAVNIASESREITVPDAAEKHITKKTYIYYTKASCGCFSRCNDCSVGSYSYRSDYDRRTSGGSERSKPILVKTEDVVVRVPLTYKVSTTGDGTATICDGKPTEVRADITVEKENSYAGYKPEVKKEYIEVSRREYKRALYGQCDQCTSCR
jgi:hypothetical protein